MSSIKFGNEIWGGIARTAVIKALEARSGQETELYDFIDELNLRIKEVYLKACDDPP